MKTLVQKRTARSARNRSSFFGGRQAEPSFFSGSNRGVIQRSTMSDQADKIWADTHDKGKIFDLLRTDQAFESSDQDLAASVGKMFKGQPDDLWLAQTIQQNGPEPLWPGALLAERHRRAVAGKWADEPGGIGGKLGLSLQGGAVNAYFFPGQTDNRALIIGGVHGSELSGIEVAQTLLTKLQTGPRPYYSVIIVPVLFPDNAKVAESKPKKIETGENVGRYTKGTEFTDHSTDPNRQMPGLGKRYDPGDPKDAKGRDIEPENRMLLELIDRFRPTRIASLHSNHDLDKAGIYADPRTDFEGKALGYDPDRDLAVEMAKAAEKGGAKVPGNQLGKKTPNAVYPLDPPAAGAGADQARETSKGISLGGWGSTAICDPAHKDANRPAMRIITVEMQLAQRVKDEPTKAKQAARQAEVGAVADALREIFLGNTDVEGTEDPCAKAPAGKP